MQEVLNKADEIYSSNTEFTFDVVTMNMLLPIAEAMGHGQSLLSRLLEGDDEQRLTNDTNEDNILESNMLRNQASRENMYYDSLTNILNKRFFEEHMRRLMNTLSRSDSTFSLMIVDVDYLKNYNDTYGHIAGDACLKAVAEVLSKSILRADDFVVRYGGDEFVVGLPNTEEDGARIVAEKMLNNTRDLAISHEKSSAADIVTISIGLATGKVMPRHRADDFILHADELLYKSKQAGHNRYTSGRL
jgi:diguanylate cyclase (GGDEF)-like protein